MSSQSLTLESHVAVVISNQPTFLASLLCLQTLLGGCLKSAALFADILKCHLFLKIFFLFFHFSRPWKVLEKILYLKVFFLEFGVGPWKCLNYILVNNPFM